MKTIKLLFAFLLISIVGIQAQTTNGEPTYYKITFLEIDQFQLKEMVPVCSEIFDTPAENKGEPNVLYFNSTKDINENQLKEKLVEKNINHIFELKIISNDK